MRGHVLAVVGGSFGSEGKGTTVARIADDYDVHVRVGGPNAGHSIWHQERVWKMQSIPCGWTNPQATLVIGAGAIVNPDILCREVLEIEAVDPTIRERLVIDSRAGVLDERHHALEGGTGGEMHRRIGSTGEGVGAAREARMRRNPDEFQHMADVASQYNLQMCLCDDTPRLLNRTVKLGSNVLLEGTQGSGLSLIHGPWPYVTSADTGAAQLAADCGVAPTLLDQVLLVARTFPIRVAGNSGPLKGEMSWDDMSRLVGKPVEEHTTVTRKVRRVGVWDEELLDQAVVLNGPTSLALTFLDYLSPEDEGKTDYTKLSLKTWEFVSGVEQRFGVPVSMVGTGGTPWQVIVRGKL